MKTLELNQMENISGSGDGQDFVSGFLCGMAIAGAVASGGVGIYGAVIGDQTRHNAGAFFVERLVAAQGVNLSFDKKYFGLTGKFSYQGRDIR